jgi:ATP-binding cassette subfamily B protein
MAAAFRYSAIFRVLPAARRREILLLFILMLVAGTAEMATIGAAAAFIALLAGAPGTYAGLAFLSPASAALIFAGAIAVAGVLRLTLLSGTQRLAFGLGHELAVDVQRRALFQPYLEHRLTHGSQAVALLEKVELLVCGTLLPMLQACSGAIIGLFMLAALVGVDALATAAAAVICAAGTLLAMRTSRARLQSAAESMAHGYDERVRLIQESRSAIRDLILDGTRETWVQHFRQVDAELRDIRIQVALAGSASRIVIETVGLIGLALLSFVLSSRPGGLAAALPTTGALALGAHRLLPLVQSAYQAWVEARSNNAVAADVLRWIEAPMEAGLPHPPLRLASSIQLEKASFTYPGRSAPAVRDISLTIPAGSRVALVGPSGSGKSTLADLVMGLLLPTTGAIRIDGQELRPENVEAWRRNIAHVPQHLVLADATIAENIAFGRPDLGTPAVRHAARLAAIDEFILTLPDGYATSVGEHGLRLSGGQRQRLALARAIARQTPVLVLDEPTSALDAVTSAGIRRSLDVLQSEGRTLLLVAHDPAMLDGCDLIVELDAGEIVRVEDRRAVARA